MKVIRDNLVGLFRFIGLLCSMLIPVRPSRPTHDFQKEPAGLEDKYPPLPLTPTETKFCPECHILVCQIRRTKQGVQIIQDGKTLITVGSNVIIQEGKREKGFPIKCPNGHTVRIE